MKNAFYVSFSLHFFWILVYILFRLIAPAPMKLEHDGSFVVNFEKVGKVSKAPVLSPHNQKVVAKKAAQKAAPTEEPKKPVAAEEKKDVVAVQDKKKKDKAKDKPAKKPSEKASESAPAAKDRDASAKKDAKVGAPGKKDQAGTSLQEGQRASEVGDEVTASEVGYIQAMVKRLWVIPSMIRDLDVSIQVSLTIDGTGKVKQAIIESHPLRHQDPQAYELLVNSIEAVVENPEFEFSCFSEDILQGFAKGRPLVLEFNPYENG